LAKPGGDKIEGEIIFASIISLIGMIIVLQLRDRAWFKKTNFKFKLDAVKQENKLKMEKLRKELNLKPDTKTAAAGLGGSGILDLLKNVTPEQAGAFVEYLQGGGEIPPLENIADLIEDNKDLISAFLGGLKNSNTKEPENNMVWEG